MRGILEVFWYVVRGQGEGCLATKLQVVMGPYKARAGLTTQTNRSLEDFANIIY